MKFKKIVLMLLVLPLLFILVSCDDDLLEIGILQFVETPALTHAREGFVDALEAAGYIDGVNIKINVQNPQKDASIMAQMSKNLVRNSDLILAIATPAAISIVNEAREQRSDVPILFTAVTDPLEEDLIDSNEEPGGNVTGTNDMNPIVEQISLAKRIVPTAKKLGIIYTASETNSEKQANIAKAEAEKLELEVVISTITSVTDLRIVAGDLAERVDIIYVPTDNSLASTMNSLTEITSAKNVPIIAGEENMIYDGGSITYSIDYYRLGEETATQAIKILKDGLHPQDIPSFGLSEFKLIVNKKKLEEMGFTVAQDLLDEADEIIE